MNESFINAEELIKQITDAFYQQVDAVKRNKVEVDQLNQSYGKLPSDYLKTIKAITDAQIRSAKAEKEMANASIASQRAKQAEITTRIKENAELREQIRLSKAQETQNRNTGGSYRQLSAELNTVRNEAKNLATDMYLLDRAGEKNTATYTQLENQFTETQARVNQLDTTLKGIDASVGQHQRNVGNYSSAFNGLGSSINQITREFPAFAVSVNTGILALSNNIPILVDEITRLRAANAELISQGQPVQSVFSQIVRSVFSWQTALSAGITLLTLYGGKLTEWIMSHKSATKEVDLLREATERFNDTLVETTTNSEKQLTNANRLIAVMKDETKSIKERTAAAEELKGLYPGYLEDLTTEEMILGRNQQQTESYNKAMRQLTADINKRVSAEAKQNAARESLKIAAEIEQEVKIRERANEEAAKAIELYGFESGAAQQALKSIRERIEARKEQYAEDAEFIAKFGTIGIADSGPVTGIGLYTEAQITQLALRGQALRAEYENQAELTNAVIQETSLLDYNPIDQQEMQIEALRDFAASEYELNLTRLENQAAYYREVRDNEENDFKDREYASQQYNDTLIKMAELRLSESVRVTKRESELEIAEVKRRAKELEITQKNASEVITSIQAQANYDIQTAHEVFSQDIIDANKEVEDSFKNIYKDISEQERQNKVTQQQIANMRQLGLELDNVSSGNTAKQFAELENRLRALDKAGEDLQIKDLQDQRAIIDSEIERISALEKNKENNEAINKLLGQQYAIDEKILGIENQRKQAVADLSKEMKQATTDYLQGISSNSLTEAGFSSLTSLFEQTSYEIVNELGEIETKTGSVFDKLYDQAGTAQEKFAVAFNTISNIVQDSFNFINQASQQNFDLEYERLERRKEIALKFAGDSQAAQEEINRQYEERQREIKKRELRQQKEQAVFNAVINTAQGVTAALAQANIPLSVLIGILGAAQISFIASQEIPAYADGGITEKDGAILVNDAKGSNYREVIETPSGKKIFPSKRNTVLNVPKGTRIYKNYADHDARLREALDNTGIAPYSQGLGRGIDAIASAGGGGISKQDMIDAMDTSLSKLAIVNNQFDAGGYNSYVEKQGARTAHLNNVKTARGITFR